MRRSSLLAGFLAVTLMAVPPATAQPRPSEDEPFEVRVTEGIVYGQGQVNRPAPASFDLLLDLYEPVTRSKRRRPAVVLIHGGGFTRGSRRQPQLVTIARALAERGIVVASIDYRLGPQDPVPSARVAPVAAATPDIPLFTRIAAAIDDTLTALDWLRDHAGELRVHPNRLGLAGGSAGAATAVHVAYVLDDLDVDAPRFRFVGNLWGAIAIDIGAQATQLEAGEAALFVVHGTADRTVPIFLNDRLVARAEAVGVPVEYHRVEGAGHGFPAVGFFTREVAPGQTAFERMLDFAENALR